MSEEPIKSKESSNLPKGFDTRVGRAKGDGWLKKVPGVVIIGRLQGRYEMKGQQNDDGSYRVFYQVQLQAGSGVFGKDGKPASTTVPASAKNPETDEKMEVELSEGQVVNIDEHKALEDLADYCGNGGIYDVYIRYVSQDPIPGKGKKTFWQVDGPHLRTIKAGTVRHVQRSAVPVGQDDRDIPF